MGSELPNGLSRVPASGGNDYDLPNGLSRSPSTGNNLDLPEDIEKRKANLAKEMSHATVDNPETADYIINEAKRGLVDLFSIGGVANDVTTGALNTILDLFADDVPDLKPEHLGLLGTKGISDELKKVAFVKELEPPTDAARYVGAIARFGAPTVVTGPGIAASSFSKIDKARAILTEVASSFGGGIGSEIGADIGKGLADEFDITPEEGESFGRMAGGITGALSPLPLQKGISVAGGRLKAFRDPKFQKELGRNKAGIMLRNEIESFLDAKANLARSEALRTDVQGFNPSLGRATGAPGLMSIEKRLAEETSNNLNQAIKADRESISAIATKLQKDFPEGSFNVLSAPKAVFKRAQMKLKSTLAKTEATREAMGKAFTAKPNAVIGERLRELRDDAEGIARTIKNTKYSDVYAEAKRVGLSEEVSGVHSAVSQIVNDNANTFQSMPVSFSEILSKWAPKKPQPTGILMPNGTEAVSAATPKTVEFEELHSLMKRVNGDYFALKRSNPTQAFHINKIRKILNEKVDKYLDTKYGDVATKLHDANKFYLDGYQSVFKKSAGGKMDNYNRYQEITPDEKIVSSIFLDRKDGIDDFFKIYGTNDEAYTLLKDGILDNFARTAISKTDGTIIKAAAARFTERHSEKLNKLPEIKSIITNAEKANAALIDRQSLLRNKITKINGSKLKSMAGVESLDKLLDDVIKNKKSMVSLISYVKKFKGGKVSLAHSIAEKVRTQPDPYKYLMDNKGTIQPALDMLSPGHFKNLSDIAEATSIIDRSKLPVSVNTSFIAKDPIEVSTGTSFRSMLSQARMAAQGRVSQEYVMADIGGKFLFTVKEKEANRLLQSAFYDHDIAATLAKVSASKKITAVDANKIRLHLYSIGARSGAFDNDDNQLEEVY